MSPDLPSHRYYRSMHGSWRCTVDFALTDRPAFWASPMGWVDRLRVLSLVWVQRWIGPPVLETTVDYTGGTEVIHTTRVSTWGMTGFRSVERMTLDPDGRRATMRGDQLGEGTVEIDETATRAHYTFRWVGVRMDQHTEVVPEGLKLVQETPWSRSVQLLCRV
jgi:hypothetical protein